MVPWGSREEEVQSVREKGQDVLGLNLEHVAGRGGGRAFSVIQQHELT